MILKRRYDNINWDNNKKKIIDWWINQKFNILSSEHDKIIGYRGSLLGNLFSFNMGKLKTKIQIEKNNENGFELIMEVTTIFQFMTKTNIEFWDLELKTFKEYINSGGLLEEEWSKYEKKRKRNNFFWVISFVLILLGIDFILKYILSR